MFKPTHVLLLVVAFLAGLACQALLGLATRIGLALLRLGHATVQVQEWRNRIHVPPGMAGSTFKLVLNAVLPIVVR
jgi:hypothetical protein